MSIIFFFVQQKTAYEMRISDWSSDVCSSDLSVAEPDEHVGERGGIDFPVGGGVGRGLPDGGSAEGPLVRVGADDVARIIVYSNEIQGLADKIGRASCRERVCQSL